MIETDMTKEIWKDIKELPTYQVSNFGNVRVLCGINKYKYKNVKVTKNGYHMIGVSTYKGRKWYLVSRLVLCTFDDKPYDYPMQANHKDEDKDNNRLDNLNWLTAKENCNYGTRNEKCKEAIIKPIKCVETGIIYESAREASRITGANYGSISNVIHGKRNVAGGYHWVLVDKEEYLKYKDKNK